jgi:hypothetical protein
VVPNRNKNSKESPEIVSKLRNMETSALGHLSVHIHTLERSLHLECVQSSKEVISRAQLKFKENKSSGLNHVKLPTFDYFDLQK